MTIFPSADLFFLLLNWSQLTVVASITIIHKFTQIIVMFLLAVWTLILTAPIDYRGSIGEQLMQC